ncbi:helix-turn-helix domain-containing protein [Dactylosporangium vinaceum]|uniref:Helix-turn-helix domain-containing protein n=1 Tax=Dactylosporangium vinaceum TaxID=53362 RepID=A0ABV5MQR5_9ACTN|nr:helix-turn-helix transcriptional regulator [Dactylosporangium vinaceum]UAB96366.1 helix-turn-helix domain-containing protein [Dactylosporangium vinaceum]
METPETLPEMLRRLRTASGRSAASIGVKVNLSRSAYSNVEAGRRQFTRDRVEILDRLYGCDGALTRAWENDNVRRRNLLAVGAAMAMPGIAGGLRLPPLSPQRVTPDDLTQIDAVAHALVTWDNAFGGGQALAAGQAQLEWAAALLDAECDPSLREALFVGVGRLSSLAGFMAFDAFAHQRARELFTFAFDCARQTSDFHLRAFVLSSMARQAVWCGRPHDAIATLDQATSFADRLTATERTDLLTVRSRALGKLGPAYAEAALRTVGEADEQFTQSRPDLDPTWIAFYDTAQHHGDTAHALFDVAIHGRSTEAVSRFDYAVSNHQPGYTRSRTISLIKQATLMMATGDPRQAASVGQGAVQPAARLKSQRARTDLIALRSKAEVHVVIPEVGELVERIDEAIGHDAGSR